MSGSIKPFAEQGNFTAVHNAVLDRIMPRCPPSAFKVLMFILRRTHGWHQDEESLSYAQIQAGTGIKSRDTIASGLAWLKERDMVIITPTGQDTPTRYLINRKFALSGVPISGTPPVPKTGTLIKKVKQSNDKASKEPLSAHPQKESAPMGMGQYGIKELMDRIEAARESGAEVHTPTNKERASFGQMFAQCASDGRSDDELMLALDYMVAKAAGNVEGEPKAWCGFRTALDRVIEGWRPSGVLSAQDQRRVERAEAFRVETMRMMEEAMNDDKR